MKTDVEIGLRRHVPRLFNKLFLTITPIIVFLSFNFQAFSKPTIESIETIRAKYEAETARGKAQIETIIFYNIISKKGMFFDTTDYYESGMIDKQYHIKKKDAAAHSESIEVK